MSPYIKSCFAIFFLLVLSTSAMAQENPAIHNIQGDTLFVMDAEGVILDFRVFSQPEYFYYDLDSDDADELIVIDKSARDSTIWYVVFVFELNEGFFLADSVTSGFAEPVIEFSEELNSLVITAGNPDFDALFPNSDEQISYPIQFWVYTGVEFLNVNTDIYNFFLEFNEVLEKMLEEREGFENPGCEFSQANKRLIAAIYINLRHAFEDTLAEQFLMKYYNCPDRAEFKKIIEQFL